MEEIKNRQELEYTKAKLSKRVLSGVVDLFFTLFLTFILFALTNLILPNLSFYQEIITQREELQYLSNLYLDDGTLITEYTENSSDFETFEERKTYLSERINIFYQNELFFDREDKIFEEYDRRKLEYQVDDIGYIFERNSENIVVERNINPEYLYQFYKNEINNYSIGYLINNSEYLETTRSLFFLSLINLSIWFIFSITIFYLIFPLFIFKRGRKTIGMVIFSIGLIDITALNISWKKYLLRFIFTLIFMFILNIFAFLIPLIISLGMMYCSKRNQDLVDYIFNNYVVETKNSEIYLNYLEYLDKSNIDKKTKLEDKNLNIGN